MLQLLTLVLATVSTATTEPQGTTIAVGGGRIPAKVIEQFVKLAGEKQGVLVVIPTASSRTDEKTLAATKAFWLDRGIGRVEVLHTRDRKLADSDEFVRPLASATAVWFGGGQQQRIADAYLGTKVEKQVLEVMRRGGVVGGTSAGAAIQSRVMIAGGKTEARVSEGFDLVPGAVIDQHFRQRKRDQRLEGVIRQRQDVTGIGIDEETAILVRAGKAEVLGNKVVTVITSNGSKKISRRIYRPGDKFEWQKLKIE